VEKQKELKEKQLNLMLEKAERDFAEGNYISFDSADEMSSFLMDSAKNVIANA